ncbi:MAG: D-alanyl-D-alanine carboxypeptidase [candidate division NC10 bacterium]|nr:D-alanyl-D-alanine carboxypeptidase [candidate division NC10 bacterium]
MVPVRLLAAFLLAGATAHAAEDRFPDVASAYLVRVREQVLWAGHPTKRLPPASLTKLMTALLVLENYRPEAVVSVGRAAAAETGARLGLKAGERMRVKDLLAATLVRSANDACHALAAWRAGSQARFVTWMNRRAAELGLTDTWFANACGLDAPGHYSSVQDLAVLADAAMRHATLADLVARTEAVVRTADGRRTFRFKNRNALIGRLPGAIGVKSGYTRKAGPCVVALAEREGVRVLLIMLNASNRWWDAHGMIERAFAEAGRRRE